MVKGIRGPSSQGYFGKSAKGKPIELNRDGSIREYHDKWNDPEPKRPESKPNKKKDWEIPGIPYKHPPDNLVPLGGGFFMTPDDEKNKDPMNCDGNLADISPWCGGNPLTKQALGLNPEISFDECNVWVELQPVLGFVKLAPVQLAYRFPGSCRNQPPPPEPPPPPSPGQNYIVGLENFDGFDDNDYVYVFSSAFGFEHAGEDGYGVLSGTLSCPGGIDPMHPERGISPVSCTVQTLEYNGFNNTWTSYYWEPDCVRYYIGSDGATNYRTFRGSTFVQDASVPITGVVIENFDGFIITGTLRYGKVKDVRNFITYAPEPDPLYTGSVTTTIRAVVYPGCTKPNKNKNNPPPPLPPDKPCCMACCNQPQDQDNALLKEILAQVKLANKAIGSSQFPATFPKGLTKANRDTSQEVPDVANLLKQMCLYLDEVTGQYSIEIQVDDINPTQEGNQSQTFELKNQAETLAEMFGMMINNSMNSELLVQLCVKALIETGVVRQQIHNTQSQVKTIVDYLGYHAEEKSEDVPFTFTVPQSSNINDFKMDDFLKSSNQKVEIVKIDNKEVGKHRVYMLLLEKTSGIIKALFWRNLGKDAAQVAGKVKDLLKKQDATIKQVDKHDAELEAVLEDFERGYTDFTPYVGDSSKPYGEEYTSRPKTRIIKKPTTDGGTGTP